MKYNQLKVGVALSYVSMGLGYLISIFYTPVMLRLLGQSEYGLYNLVASVVAYVGILNFGFGSAYMRYFSRYRVIDDAEQIAILNGMFMIVYTIIGLIALLAGLTLSSFSHVIYGDNLTYGELSKAKILMQIMAVNMAISFPASVFDSYITANESFIFQKFLQMIKVIFNPLIMLPVLFLGYKSIGMIVVTTIINLIIDILNLLHCQSKLKMKFVFNRFDFTLMREMTIFSSFVFMNMIIDQINWNVDKFIIGRFRGTVSVAVYGLAAQLNTYYLSISTSISNVFIPRVNRLVAASVDHGEMTRLFTRVGRMQFVFLSLIGSGLVIFGRPFIVLWAGANYADSYGIALLLILPVTIPLIQNIGIEIQRAKNMHQFRSVLYLVIALANVAISIPLTKSYGGFGAALGTALSLLIGNGLIMNWYYHNRIGLDMQYFWKEISKFSPVLIILAIVGYGLNRFVNLYNLITFIASGIFYIMVFMTSVWFLGLNKNEKDLFSSPILRLLKVSKQPN